MKIKKLKLGKEIVANLSDFELNQIKGEGGTSNCQPCLPTEYENASCFCGTTTSAAGPGCPTYFPCYTNQ